MSSLGAIRGEVRFKELLGPYTSLRIGGPADIFIVPQDIVDIRIALDFATEESLPLVILGGGNGVVISESGIRGVVLRISGCLGRMERYGDSVLVGAGMGLSALILEAAQQDLGGLECLTGIPATVGGAVVSNASGPDGQIGDVLSAVYFLYPDGRVGEITPGGRAVGIDPTTLPSGAIVVGARFQLRRRPQAEIRKDVRQRMIAKKKAMPLLASVGVWKPTLQGPTVQDLIEQVGLKGKRYGGARISEKNCGFIINWDNATATAIRTLMRLTRKRVSARFGIELDPAVRVLGGEA